MKNKNSQSKKISYNSLTGPGIAKKIVNPLLWTTMVVIGLWSLMHFSIPETKLEPYTKFKKISTTIENTADTKSELKLGRFAESSQPSFSDMADVRPEPKPAGGQLPRKTLQHIQKGMQLIEKGKYNSADIEFKKAAQNSPDSPEVFALWGTALRVQEKYKGANRHFTKALELSPNDAETSGESGLFWAAFLNSISALLYLPFSMSCMPFWIC
jgi:tetratricopeptide (TPR) repeat protein